MKWMVLSLILLPISSLAMQKKHAPGKDAQNLEDANAILFRLKDELNLRTGLPKALQQCVFSYLQEMEQTAIFKNHADLGFGLLAEFFFPGISREIRFLSSQCLCAITNVNGKQLLACVPDYKTIRLCDPNDGTTMHTLEGHTLPIYRLSTITEPNGKQLLASGSLDETIRLWDPSNGKAIHTLNTDSFFLGTITDPNDKQLLAYAPPDKTIHLWDPSNESEARTLKGQGEIGVFFISHCPINANGKQLHAFGSNDGTICLWDLENDTIAHTLKGHTGPVYRLGTIPDADGKQLLASGGDSTVRLWDLSSGAEVHIKKNSSFFTGIDFHGTTTDVNGNQLLAFSANSTIRLKDPNNGNTAYTLKGHTDRVARIVPLTDVNGNQLLASSSVDGTIRSWGYGPGEFEKTVINQKNLENAHVLYKELSDQCDGNGLPQKIQRLIYEYAISPADEKEKNDINNSCCVML